MKIALMFAAFVAIAVAAPESKTPVPILQYDEKRDGFGQFSISYQTGDGLTVVRQGELKPTGDGKDHVLVQSGSQIYTAPDGSIIKLIWTADETGYHPKGDHLPVTPAPPSAA